MGRQHSSRASQGQRKGLVADDNARYRVHDKIGNQDHAGVGKAAVFALANNQSLAIAHRFYRSPVIGGAYRCHRLVGRNPCNGFIGYSRRRERHGQRLILAVLNPECVRTKLYAGHMHVFHRHHAGVGKIAVHGPHNHLGRADTLRIYPTVRGGNRGNGFIGAFESYRVDAGVGGRYRCGESGVSAIIHQSQRVLIEAYACYRYDIHRYLLAFGETAFFGRDGNRDVAGHHCRYLTRFAHRGNRFIGRSPAYVFVRGVLRKYRRSQLQPVFAYGGARGGDIHARYSHRHRSHLAGLGQTSVFRGYRDNGFTGSHRRHHARFAYRGNRFVRRRPHQIFLRTGRRYG